MNNRLKFSSGNSKLGKNTLILSLPAGWACPAAKECKSFADPDTGRIKDGPHCRFRCFGATSECRSPALRKNSWHNFNLLKAAGTRKAMADLIDESMPEEWPGLVRIHSTGGDFFTKEYLEAWCDVARRRPGKIEWFGGKPYPVGTVFYSYTKALNQVVGMDFPDNFRLVASLGGEYDRLVSHCGIPTVRVVFSEREAELMGLQIDHDDTLAWASDSDFALMIHGTQPKGSEAAEALKMNRREGKFTGYGRKPIKELV